MPELIDSFQTDTTSRFERLDKALAQHSTAMLKAEAHAVRGSAQQMGAQVLAALFQVVEDRAPEMVWPELTCQIRQAEAQFAEASSTMAKYVRDRQRRGD